VVKYSLSRYAGRCPPLEDARTRIRAAAERAVAQRATHRLPDVGAGGAPVTLEVRFGSEQHARMVALMSSVERQGLDEVRYEAPNAVECSDRIEGNMTAPSATSTAPAG